MMTVKTRIHVAEDGTLSGRAAALPAGDHDAEILLLGSATSPSGLDVHTLLVRIREIQADVARLPVLDPRSPDEMVPAPGTTIR